MSSLIAEAAKIAILAHAGQKRKNTGEDYIVHPFRVFGILSLHLKDFGNDNDRIIVDEDITKEEILAAALLHDVIEDCPDQFGEMIRSLSQRLYNIVWALSNPSRFMEGKPRVQRKEADFNHIKLAIYGIKLIKIADRLDNWSCFSKEKHMYGRGNYVQKYTEETKTLVKVLTPPLHKLIPYYSDLLAELNYQVNGEH